MPWEVSEEILCNYSRLQFVWCSIDHMTYRMQVRQRQTAKSFCGRCALLVSLYEDFLWLVNPAGMIGWSRWRSWKRLGLVVNIQWCISLGCGRLRYDRTNRSKCLCDSKLWSSMATDRKKRWSPSQDERGRGRGFLRAMGINLSSKTIFFYN